MQRRAPLKRKSAVEKAAFDKRKAKTRAKTKQSVLLARADKLAGQYIRSLGYCEACGYTANGKTYQCSDRLEWAHLKSRRHKTIRHSPNNALCLCNIHHRFFTEHPDLWTSFIEEKYPGRWDQLNSLLREGGKPDYAYWIEFYEARLRGEA